MPEDISIWELRGASRATRIAPKERMETELVLEDVLTANPELIAPDLTLVGRQTPIDGAFLDLLGVDADGRLVVLELKRAQLTRDAVAQVIDYGASLERLPDSELAELIADHSGTNGIDRIGDFESWYVERHGTQMDALRPVRMVVVGLGADARADRMVAFLNKHGADISLLTFHAFEHSAGTLLARHADRRPSSGARSVPRTRSELLSALHERARELGAESLWRDATEALGSMFNSYPKASGMTFSLPTIRRAGQNARSSHSVTLLDRGGIRVTFFPIAVHLCQERFRRQQAVTPFEQEQPPNTPPVGEVSQQWTIEMDDGAWTTHRDGLRGLAKAVHAAWHEHAEASAE